MNFTVLKPKRLIGRGIVKHEALIIAAVPSSRNYFSTVFARLSRRLKGMERVLH